MSNEEDTYRFTKKTKAVLDLFRAFKKFQELVKSGIESDTVFLQAFFGVYYAVLPAHRPDYIMTVSDLYDAMKEAHLHLSQFNQESEDVKRRDQALNFELVKSIKRSQAGCIPSTKMTFIKEDI